MWTPPNREFPPPKPGEPPLHAAARTGDHDAIRALIGAGADVEAVFDLSLDPSGRERPATPLMVAAGSGDGASAETVALLIELGADPTRVVQDASAAVFACEGLGWNYRPGGDAQRLQFLLESGASLPDDPATRNRMLCETAESGDDERLRVLLERGVPAGGFFDPDQAAREQRDLMASMAEFRATDPEFAKLPPEMLSSMETMDEEMYAEAISAPSQYDIPLFRAAMSGNAACVRLILDHGADPLTRDSSQTTAMYHAASEEVVRTLMDAGVPIDDTDKLEWSPIIHAVSDGLEGLPLLEALIACGADVNATHDRGYTVFMSAVGAMERHPRTLETLIQAGADPHAVSDLGYNAFHAAIDVNGEANDESSIRATLTFLKDLGVDIEARTADGYTPLARAIEEGIGLEVRVLCELGADPNAGCMTRSCLDGVCEEIEMPPLFAAVSGTEFDKDEKVDALLVAGADQMVTSDEGFTPLVLVLAQVFADADDYDATFEQFFHELAPLVPLRKVSSDDRDAFLDTAIPILDEFVERFARDIPVDHDAPFASEWREARLRTITLLLAHEWFIRCVES